MKLTQERLKEVLHYDPETGAFAWAKTVGNNAKIGQVAGNINKTSGYRQIRVDNKLYKASRLIWLYMKGYFPEYEVDHKNRVRHDDRWKNLRHVSRQCNSRNCKIRNDNKSGITGIYWYKRLQKWCVRIMISGKMIHLGLFTAKLNAAKARWKAEVKYGFPGCNSTSSAYQYLQSKGGNYGRYINSGAFRGGCLGIW